MSCQNPDCPCECHHPPADDDREWDDAYGGCTCDPPRLKKLKQDFLSTKEQMLLGRIYLEVY